MTLKTIRLELARNPDFPEGSAAHGYDLKAPLDMDGHLDAEAWRKQRADCRVRRFWAGADDRHGELIHTRQGWAFSSPSSAARGNTIHRAVRFPASVFLLIPRFLVVAEYYSANMCE